MVKITSYEDQFFYPPEWPGLEEVVRFPDGEMRPNALPNSTVWVLNDQLHRFNPEILGSDVGCGMSGFILGDIDHQSAADSIYAFLKQQRSIGNGNHFIDLCAPIESGAADIKQEPYKVMLIHTHGPDKSTPKNIEEAQQKQKNASSFRRELGEELSALLGSRCELLGDWAHNTVAVEEDKIIYRKGAVKVEAGKLHPLPAHAGAKILLYTPNPANLPPYSSMPHATGRRGPLGEIKVSAEEAELLRQMVYIPAGISSHSLRSVHPSCYNDYGKIFRKLRDENNFFVPMGEMKILSYIGKV